MLKPELAWLWEQIGRAADRRGDAALIEGALSLRAPDSAEARAAAAGLVGGRVLKQGQARTVDLGTLTLKLRVRGAHLTPGAVAAHALGRSLATRALAVAQREVLEHELLIAFLDLVSSLRSFGSADPQHIWAVLRRSGWIARLLGAEDPAQLLRSAVTVVNALPAPEARVDRRRLASDATGDPHALDHGSPLAGLVIAMLVAARRMKARLRPRAAWASVGVACDDIVGGLVAVGLVPVGWRVPRGEAFTLPPRILRGCDWPSPDASNAWIFVTENPSVATAAADLAAAGQSVRLLCTDGTPSADEIAAIARLASKGWNVAVRADFDAAGLGHVAAILRSVPRAVPWRMGPDDYLESLRARLQEEGDFEKVPDSPWDPKLAVTMREVGIAGYEEALLESLIADLKLGAPGDRDTTAAGALEASPRST